MRLLNLLHHRHLAALLALVAASCVTNARAQDSKVQTPATPEVTLEQRLDRLCEQLEKQRQDLHIPGFAIAIVSDDQIILSKGFGVRDVENNIPVMPETLFAIGSSTKAFTAALVAMLVDEGKMTWDDPVRQHLPEFHLSDKEADENVTIRDLLSHRSGLERTDLLWASGQATRQEIIAAVAKAEPKSKFREAFHYQNVMYLAAGLAAANAAGFDGDWDALIVQRLFTPLGMKGTNTDIEQARKSPVLSLGYSWDEEKKQFKHRPMRNLNTIAPAGAINSNVIDMAQWLRLQLGKGEIDGRRLINAERFDEMRTKESSIAEGAGVDYGLGWMLHDWQGRRIVEHGGNIDGFAAQVTLVPEANLGYALLTNVTMTPLQQMSIGLVCEALLGEWSETPDTPLDPASVKDYLGKYRMDVLKTDVTVQMKDGKLAVDVPGQMVFTLKPPTDEGKWVFELTDSIAVSFVKDDAGTVLAMNFYQAGMIFECLKEGATLPVEIGLDEAQKYLGRYRDEQENIDVTVLHRNGRLAIDVPKQMIFDLRLPNEDGKWVFRASDKLAVRFEQDSLGNVTGMTHFQDGPEHLLPRIADAGEANAKPPTVEELLALHERGCGSAAIAALGGVRLTGTMHMLHQGIDHIDFTALCDGFDRYTQYIDMEKFGWIRTGCDGRRAWSDSLFERGEELPANTTGLMRLQNPLLPVGDWRTAFDRIEITRLDRLDEREVVVVELSIGDDARCIAQVDRENGRTLQVDYKVPVPGLGSVDTSEKLLDWREVDGLVMPMRWEIDSDLYGKTVIEIRAIETKVELTPDAFTLPKR
jgi:CubicO group peptidase (beta-lactamase class C family)